MTWLDTACDITAAGGDCVLVTVAETRGSAPREVGVKMLVHAGGIDGTIGGGNLEYRALAGAGEMLTGRMGAAIALRRFTLGPDLGQCCGGQVRVLFEKLSPAAHAQLSRWRALAISGQLGAVVTQVAGGACTRTILTADAGPIDDLPIPVQQQVAAQLAGPSEPRLVVLADRRTFFIEPAATATQQLFLFGAGHVGKAIVHALAPLRFQITWIDGRRAAFPADASPQVSRCVSASPASEVARAPAETLFLVMTHSHSLDLEICARVLESGHFAFLGLIGSETKRARFASRLRALGIPPEAVGRLTCPIGVPGIVSKDPAAIAAAVAAQLLIIAERRQALPASARKAHVMGS